MANLNNIVKNHLKDKNDSNMTPISKMLKLPAASAPKLQAIQKLFSQDWIDYKNQDTFKGIEDQVIEGFFHRSVSHYKEN